MGRYLVLSIKYQDMIPRFIEPAPRIEAASFLARGTRAKKIQRRASPGAQKDSQQFKFAGYSCYQYPTLYFQLRLKT